MQNDTKLNEVKKQEPTNNLLGKLSYLPWLKMSTFIAKSLLEELKLLFTFTKAVLLTQSLIYIRRLLGP